MLADLAWDIVEHKFAEEEIGKLWLAIEQSPVSIVITDTSGAIEYVNPKFTEITGYTHDESIGKNPRILKSGETPPEEYRRLWDIVTNGGVWGGEFHNRKKNGDLYWESASISPVMDSYGRIKNFIAVKEDITARKQAEEALRRSEEMYRSIFRNSPLGIFRSTFEGRFIEVNPAMAKMLGYDSPETVVREIDDIAGQIYACAEDRRRILSAQFDSADITQHLNRFRRRDGKEFVANQYLKTVRDAEGRPVFLEGIIEDITEKLLLESQLRHSQKMEAVGRLAGGVAHDFNNMLGVIIGRAELALNRMDKDSPLIIHLQEIRQAAERSANLARQLLAFARKQTIAPRVLALNETVEGMLKMLRHLIGEDIDLVWMPGAESWQVKVDPSQIDQILANLCVNARDAIAGVGKVTLKTSTATFDRGYCADHPGSVPGEYVLLAVSDDGCGMDKETLDKLFEPFFTTKELGKGTGLGLATVYGIVKQNNGFIDVCSKPGHGSTFRIYLPRHTAKSERMPGESPAAPVARGNETVLLVEDEPAILNMARRMLEEFGYRVMAASTPGEAIRLAREHVGEIHLLVTDVVMPEMNGRELTSNLVSLYPGIRRLFMSGYTGDVIAHHGVLDEDVNFIQKPFSVRTLAAKVREVLDSRS
jgi:PAS domain S-box-containing protein